MVTRPRASTRHLTTWPITLLALLTVPGFAFADVVVPADVTGIKAVVSASGDDVFLSWDPVTLDAAGNPETVDSYNIYRGLTPDFVADKAAGSNRIGNVPATDFTDPGIAADAGTYYYLVSAVDADGNEGPTRPSKVRTLPVLSGRWTDTSIDSDWTDAQPTAEVAGYRFYYGRSSRNYEYVVDVSLATSHSLNGLELWINWYMAVTAVDLDGNESAFSNEHIDAIAGRVRHRVHDDLELCWGAAGCPPAAGHVQRRDGWQLNVPTTFPEGDWTSVLVTFTMDSKLCEPPAGGNVTRCGSGNPCPTPPCNGGYNTCGDPWDREASLFLVLDEDCISGAGGSCRVPGNIELIRAATPFGTDAPPPDGTGRVPPRELTLDITPYAPLLTGDRWVGAEIGHFVQKGWWVTVDFAFSERADEASPKPPADGIASLFFGGATPPTASLSLPATATSVYTRLFTTGHGGGQFCDGGARDGLDCTGGCPGGVCSTCDEFCHRTNQIIVDGTPVWQFAPWRDDCSPGANPCFNWNSCGFPSCTYSRAGWCPGYIACHHDAPCDQDLDMTTDLPSGATYDLDYNVTPLNGSWSISLAAYWYE